MIKSDLTAILCKKHNLSLNDAKETVDLIFNGFIDALKNGGRIEIRGFGSFEAREYKSYAGRNPKTGKPINVQSKKIPFFKIALTPWKTIAVRSGDLPKWAREKLLPHSPVVRTRMIWMSGHS